MMAIARGCWISEPWPIAKASGIRVRIAASVYILTRPLGASLGDLLSQPVDVGGLGLGTVVTSGLFLAVILALVVWLTASRKQDAIVQAR